jgi:hypothetical protein
MNRNGKWIDTLCSGANLYVCESPAPADVCKSLCLKFVISCFFILLNDIFLEYQFNITSDSVGGKIIIQNKMARINLLIISQQKIYDDAKFECLKRNMSIAKLETVEKNMCLMHYLAEEGMHLIPATVLTKIFIRTQRLCRYSSFHWP